MTRSAAFPFNRSDAQAVLEHSERPAAYFTWRELLPLLPEGYRIRIGNWSGWHYPSADRPLGVCDELWSKLFPGVTESDLDAWRLLIGSTPVRRFLDHQLPFLMNVEDMVGKRSAAELLHRFLEVVQVEAPTYTALQRMALKLHQAWPDDLLIEVTRSCNFACAMCSSRTGGFLPERTMSLDLFTRIVRHFAPHVRSIRINGYGETTLVPGLRDYLDVLDGTGFLGRKELITNLSADPAIYADLMQRGFVLLISWDSLDPGVFEQLRTGADHARMISTLAGLKQHAAHAGQLVLLMTVQQKNVQDIPGFVDLAASVGSGLVIYNMVNEADGSPWMTERLDEIRSAFEEAGHRSKHAGVDVRIPDHVGPHRIRTAGVHRTSGTFCDRPWKDLMISYEGEVTICNMFNPYSLGMLNMDGPHSSMADRMENLWGGPVHRLFRELVNSEAPHPYCEDCYFLKA